MNMSEIKLKRCPFCKEELEVVGNGHYYAHITNGCILSHLCFETGDVEAIEKWNTRKPMQEIVERLEELKEERADVAEHTLDIFPDGQVSGLRKAIEIVKEVGGMNE